MKGDPEQRAVQLGEYIAANRATVRAAAAVFGCSKSTVHKDVAVRLRTLQPQRARWPPAPRCILPAVPPAVPDLLSYPHAPCIVLLQPMRRAGQLCRQGLTFAARLRYTGRGHKNRGAVRLRSALSGVPFNLIRAMPA